MTDQIKTDTGYQYGGTTYQNQERIDSQGNKYTVAIPISSVQTSQPVVKAPTPSPTPDYNAQTVGVTSPYLEQQQRELELQKQSQSSDVTAMKNLYATLAGEQAFTAQQNEAVGLNKASQEYITKQAELSALNKQAAAAQQENIAQGRQLGSVSSFVAGQGSEIERNRAIRAMTIGAELDALQGNIAVAQMKVKNAVDAQFAQPKAELEMRLKMFEMNDKIIKNMSDSEQKLYERAKYATEQKMKKLDEEKKAQEDIQNMIIQAAPNAPQSIIANAKKIAEQGGSKLAVAQALGVYGGDYLKTQLLKAQIDTEKAQKAKYYADIDKIKNEMTTKGLPATTANIAKVEASQSTYDLAQELKTAQGKGGAVGFGIKKSLVGSLPFVEGTAIAGTGRATYEAKFKQLKDTLASSNLDKLKGAMSDKDIEFLRNIGTALSLDMPETAFDAELDKVANTMSKVPGVQIKIAPQNNKFNQALGISSQNIPGTSIVNSVDDNGNINFIIP